MSTTLELPIDARDLLSQDLPSLRLHDATLQTLPPGEPGRLDTAHVRLLFSLSEDDRDVILEESSRLTAEYHRAAEEALDLPAACRLRELKRQRDKLNEEALAYHDEPGNPFAIRYRIEELENKIRASLLCGDEVAAAQAEADLAALQEKRATFASRRQRVESMITNAIRDAEIEKAAHLAGVRDRLLAGLAEKDRQATEAFLEGLAGRFFKLLAIRAAQFELSRRR